MTKRLSSKLLSVILTLAICATTVFGCLMTVSAETSWVTFSAGETTNEELTEATIKLTVTLPASAEGFTATQDGKTYGGIAAGSVALDYDSDLTLTGVAVDSESTKVDANYNFYPDEFEGYGYLDSDSNGFSFMALNTDNVYYSKLTFVLSFYLPEGTKNGENFSVTASSANIAGAFDDATYETTAAVTGAIVAGCDHKLKGAGTLIYTDTVNGYAVYSDSICTGKCGNSFGPQVVPTKLPGVIDTLVYYPTEEDAAAAGSTDRYVDTKLADNGEAGDSWETAIIIDSALELSQLARYEGDATKGKYYKVADGIKGFDMSGGKINLDGTLEENLDAIITSGKRHDYGEIFFQGHFDGNGATVYGLWTKYDETDDYTPQAAGLFAYTKGNVTIKNVGVSLSYFKAKNYAGGIVGAYALNESFITDDIASNKKTGNTLTIENCSVTESHIETTTTGGGSWGTNGTGAIYGIARNSVNYNNSGTYLNDSVLVNNCFISLDADHLVSKAVSGEKSLHGGIGGTAVTSDARFTNCVVLGITPYTTFNAGYQGNDVQHTGPAAKYTNIYTDAVVGSAVDIGFNSRPQDFTTCMTQLTIDQMKGDAAIANMDLDWSVWEIDVNRGYPKFKQAENPDVVSNTSDYGLTLIGTNITYNDGGDYNYNFYYRPNTTDAGNNYPDLYVAQLNEAGTALGSFHRLEGEVLTSSPVDGVQVDDIRYTIKRLSAREIYNTLLATAVVVKDGEVLWGDTEEFSIAKYEQAIIDGNYDTADKNLAEAVLKYGKASAAALNTANDSKSGTTLYWDGKTVTAPTDDDGDGVYDIDTAEELAYITSNAVTGNYKVVDGISNIVLQPKEKDSGIMQLSGHDEVRAYFENTTDNPSVSWVKTHDRNDFAAKAFSGTFDGNGVTVWGMYSSNIDGSLFGTTAVGAVIKNLNVRNSFVQSGWYGAIISAYIYAPSTAGTITYENIEISGCQIVANSGVSPYPYDMALLYGTQQNNSLGANPVINNLLVYDNEMYHLKDNQAHTQLVGNSSWNNANTSIKNSVILDCAVSYNTVGKPPFCMSTQVVENVYSSCADDKVNTKITIIDREDALGTGAVANMPNLDWNGTWCYSSTYPSLAKGAYTSASSGKTLYWNGKAADKFYADTDGASADDPIIIDTAEELAYVATATYADTNGKYFKIADGIDKIVLQSETYGKDIVSLDSAEAVKDYFEPIIASDMSNNKATLHGWASYTWNPSYYCFSGNLDGNGVEIYGMYHSTTDINSTITNRSLHGGASGGGLFSVADNATISNLAIKNSYAKLGTQGNTHTNYSFGLIVSFGKNMNSTNNAIVIDHCTVANNYIEKKVGDSSMSRAGVVCGLQEAGAFILQNCLVYGNSATGHLTTADQDYKLGIVGGFSGGTDNVNVIATDEYRAAHPNWIVDNKYMATVLENSVVLGTPLLATDTAGTTIKYSQWLSLNAINSSNENYKNVYTDWDIENLTNADSGNFIKSYFLENCGEVVTESDLIGNTAKANEIVGIFNADNKANSNDTVWYTGNSALLSLNPPTEMIASAQEAYDAITFTSADRDVYNENNKTFGVYATSLNLKTNPYISFAFAFSGEYKSNRDKIKVIFNYKGGSKEVKVADESGALLDGWSNASNDRFHIYRFEEIPVEALSSSIEVTVTYNGTETVEGNFSVKGFGFELINAYKKAPSNYYATRIEAVKALLFYTQMLQARYTSTHPVV